MPDCSRKRGKSERTAVSAVPLPALGTGGGEPQIYATAMMTHVSVTAIHSPPFQMLRQTMVNWHGESQKESKKRGGERKKVDCTQQYLNRDLRHDFLIRIQLLNSASWTLNAAYNLAALTTQAACRRHCPQEEAPNVCLIGSGDPSPTTRA